MSLTQKIKNDSSKEYLASDGTIYLIQKADAMSAIFESDSMPDLLKMRSAANADGSEMTGEEFIDKMMTENPSAVQNMVKAGRAGQARALRNGLIGEKDADGQITIYQWTDKPAVLLGPNEINVALIPDKLAQELMIEIAKLGGPPVKAEDTTRFPEQ
jgi:hypothetical protein